MVCLFLVSQLLTDVNACEMTSNSHDMAADVVITADTNPHANHDMSNMQVTDQHISTHTEQSSCCDFECQCVQNSCNTSLTMIHLQPDSFLLKNASSMAQELNSYHTSQVASALFRPPIIC